MIDPITQRLKQLRRFSTLSSWFLVVSLFTSALVTKLHPEWQLPLKPPLTWLLMITLFVSIVSLVSLFQIFTMERKI
jgi:hypothetical protein